MPSGSTESVGVLVGGTGVSVGVGGPPVGVSVGGIGVSVGVSVGGTSVSVGGGGVAVGGTGVLVGVGVGGASVAVGVAVLFRTLDAFRIFDSVFVMTAGAQGTETVSFLAYRQVIGRTALGLGSAVSVLLFLCVIAIALLLGKALRVDLGAAGARR